MSNASKTILQQNKDYDFLRFAEYVEITVSKTILQQNKDLKVESFSLRSRFLLRSA